MESNDKSHHKRFEYCKSRPKYRASKHLTAVKVYTVVNESKHLLIFGVPKVNLTNELKRFVSNFGALKSIRTVTDTVSTELELELFTDCFHVAFIKLECARKCKKFLDARNFYGGILHISYAPEYETVEDVREKLEQRRAEVAYRLRRTQTAKRPAVDQTDDSGPCDPKKPKR